MNNIYVKLLEVQQKLEIAILATPTGEAREAITEANIFLMQAIDLAKKLPS